MRAKLAAVVDIQKVHSMTDWRSFGEAPEELRVLAGLVEVRQ